ncbi:Imm8 family immunity protein [Actinoplanes sp. NPDC049548]|uniref:Imm8 family immunity protein n=1 Tax=Actinoplanes sp. NPDC049548 TaxID=3155152 RepID=UPI003415150D
MYARIEAIEFPDLDGNWPSDTRHVRQAVTIVAGASDDSNQETFELQVCTPSKLAEILEGGESFLVGRHWLFVQEFDPAEVERYLRHRVGSITGYSWNDVAEQIGRIGQWEFASR